MSKIAIAYWSGTGNTEMMAKEIEAGARGPPDPLAIENAPDDDGKSKCQELGRVLALA